VAPSREDRMVIAITALMDVVLVLAILLLLRLVTGFFQTLSVSQTGTWYLAVTSHLVPPVAGDWAVRSPYGGVFSVDTGIVIVFLLFTEWALAKARKSLTGREEATEA
jgi:hypothetical protein